MVLLSVITIEQYFTELLFIYIETLIRKPTNQDVYLYLLVTTFQVWSCIFNSIFPTFRSEIIVASFLYLMVIICKVVINHFLERQLVVKVVTFKKIILHQVKVIVFCEKYHKNFINNEMWILYMWNLTYRN